MFCLYFSISQSAIQQASRTGSVVHRICQRLTAKLMMMVGKSNTLDFSEKNKMAPE